MKLLSIVLAYGLDLIFGDPGWLPHPVRSMGKLIEFLEKKLRGSISNQILSGAVLATAVVGLAYLGSFFAIRLAEHISRWAGFALSTVLIFTTLSTRGLSKESRSVYRSLKSGNIKDTRKKTLSHSGKRHPSIESG